MCGASLHRDAYQGFTYPKEQVCTRCIRKNGNHMPVKESDWSNQRPVDMVREFHMVYGLPVRGEANLPSASDRALRKKLVSEEYWEYVGGEDKNDLVNIAQELADMIYVIYGTALTYGFDLDEVVAEVHRANMSKLDDDGQVIRRDDGKVLKGPNYVAPNIGAIINGKNGTDSREDKS